MSAHCGESNTRCVINTVGQLSRPARTAPSSSVVPVGCNCGQRVQPQHLALRPHRGARARGEPCASARRVGANRVRTHHGQAMPQWLLGRTRVTAAPVTRGGSVPAGREACTTSKHNRAMRVDECAPFDAGLHGARQGRAFQVVVSGGQGHRALTVVDMFHDLFDDGILTMFPGHRIRGSAEGHVAASGLCPCGPVRPVTTGSAA